MPIRHGVEEGTIIGWKKCFWRDYIAARRGDGQQCIYVMLEIPPGADVIKAAYDYSYDRRRVNKKIRASKAIVLGLFEAKSFEIKGKNTVIMVPSTKKVAYSFFDIRFKYRQGKEVKPKKSFDKRIDEVCESGIHFYKTFKEAINN